MSSGAKPVPGKPIIPGTTANEAVITKDWIEGLIGHIDSADLDQAVVYIADVRAKELDQSLDPNLDRIWALRARCLICEVYDYAGRRSEAQVCISEKGEEAFEDLKAAQPETATVWKDRQLLEHLKQQCWACLHLGMVAHYRQHEYDKAFKFFDLAREILSRINKNEIRIPSKGSLARAYYCLGLAERERHNLYEARRYFSESVDCAWARIVEKQHCGKGVTFLKYSIGRALGLGMAWIAYARAAMSEANAHIVAARILLHDTPGVKYLRSYVDIVHACTERSRADGIEKISQAIKNMKAAYDALGGDAILQGASVEGHFVYAQRAAVELATAYLYAARLSGTATEEDKTAKDLHLQESLKYVKLVEESLPRSDPDGKDTRTRCNTFIARSRILRERGDYHEALRAAEDAAEVGDKNAFSRIDCWITLGEGYYHLDQNDNALELFKKARNDARAQTNPKVLAVCDLQMARCYLREKQVNVAEEIIARWKSHGSQGRANAFVQHLVEEINSQLPEPAFVIPGDTPNDKLNEAYWTDEVKKWLTQLALRRSGGDKEKAAALIGKSERTVRDRSKPEQNE